MSDEKPMKPIDGGEMPPPPRGGDPNYLTRDLESALDRAVLDLLDRVAAFHGVSRRAAASLVIKLLAAAYPRK